MTTPLEQLDALLPAITNDELLELIVRAFEEGAKRADNYADLIDDDEPPVRDVLNECLSFVARLEDRIETLSDNPRVRKASRRVRDAGEDLKAYDATVMSDA